MNPEDQPEKTPEYAVLALGITFQDMARNFRTILDNIPLIVQALGDHRIPPRPPVDARP